MTEFFNSIPAPRVMNKNIFFLLFYRTWDWSPCFCKVQNIRTLQIPTTFKSEVSDSFHIIAVGNKCQLRGFPRHPTLSQPIRMTGLIFLPVSQVPPLTMQGVLTRTILKCSPINHTFSNRNQLMQVKTKLIK